MIYKIIERAKELDASDIHIIKNYRPIFRIKTELLDIKEFPKIEYRYIKKFINSIMTSKEMDRYKSLKYIDIGYELKDIRLRIHIYRSDNTDILVLRLITKKIMGIDKLRLPKSIYKICDMENGLVIITGISGSGKSSTLAAIIEEINKNKSKIIISIEDPIEFVYTNKKSIINQRQIGIDVNTYGEGIIAALRADPDIIMIGELRDLDTIEKSITLAETGHLVLSTLHTRSVPESIDRMIDVFPGDKQEQIRIQLANTISAIVSQELRKDIYGNLIPVCEIMFTNDAIKNLIRTKASPNNILDQVHMMSKTTGSQTKAQAIERMIEERIL